MGAFRSSAFNKFTHLNNETDRLGKRFLQVLAFVTGGVRSGRRAEANARLANKYYSVRKQLVEEGLDAALSRKQRATPPVAPIFDGEKEALLIALACQTPPERYARWTLQLLEEKVVELAIVEGADDNTIGRVLKKTCFLSIFDGAQLISILCHNVLSILKMEGIRCRHAMLS